MKKADTPATPHRVYPNVKVRGETGRTTTLLEKTEVLILKVVRSLFTGAHSSTKVFSGTGKGVEDALFDNNPNIKASPVIRPRAVVSSPDNDDMIGDMNRRLMERLPSSTLQDPRNNMPSVTRHNDIQEIPRVKAGSVASTKAVISSSTNTKKGVHELVTRSSRPNQGSAEMHGVHITRPVTPAPPRSMVTKPVLQTPRSPISRPVTPPPARSPVTRPITTPPRSPVSRPLTPTVRSPITKAVTLPVRLPVIRSVTPPKRSSTRLVTPASVTMPVVSIQRSQPMTPTHSSRPVMPTQRLSNKKEKTATVKAANIR